MCIVLLGLTYLSVVIKKVSREPFLKKFFSGSDKVRILDKIDYVSKFITLVDWSSPDKMNWTLELVP